MQITIPVRINAELVGVLDDHRKTTLSDKTRSQLIRDILSEWAASNGRRK